MNGATSVQLREERKKHRLSPRWLEDANPDSAAEGNSSDSDGSS